MPTFFETRRGPLAAAIVATALSLSLSGNADASTFVRAGLEQLATSNQRIVLAQVIDAVSYWNSEGTFILTDYTLQTDETLKGESVERITITLMGGTVGDRSVLVVGGAALEAGRSYLLFLSPNNLPGAPQALSVRDHSQGVFEITAKNGGLRAISQANGHALLADKAGATEPPGAIDGVDLNEMISDLRRIVGRETTKGAVK